MKRRSKQEGTIYKKTVIRNGKEYTYWEAQITTGHDPITGKRIRKTFSGNTQKAVRMQLQEASLAIQKSEYKVYSEMPLSNWLDMWLSDFCPKIKYQTRKHYESQCRVHIKPYLGSIPLCDLTSIQIQKFYTHLSNAGHTIKKKGKNGKTEITAKPLSPKSIKNIHSILSKALNTAVKNGLIKFNPSANTEHPKVPKTIIYPLSDDEIKTLFSVLESEEFSDLYKFIIFTGLRKNEALGLTWTSINFKTNTIVIDKQLIRRPVKDGGYTIASIKSDRVRDIVVSPYVMSILLNIKDSQDQLKESNSEIWSFLKDDDGKEYDLVFTDQSGSPLNPKRVYLHYNKLAKKMGFDATRVHDLRHTFAMLSLQNGDDYKTLQENLGHASASFTLDVYGHKSKRMQIESADRMQQYIDSIDPKMAEKPEK